MKWVKPADSDRYITSECGRFRINRAPENGGWVYQAARLGSPSVIVLGRGTLDECKQACEEASNEDRK